MKSFSDKLVLGDQFDSTTIDEYLGSTDFNVLNSREDDWRMSDDDDDFDLGMDLDEDFDDDDDWEDDDYEDEEDDDDRY